MTEIPAFTKLDNAALLYPASLSKKYASLFRLSVTLKDEVDPGDLESALCKTLDRFPIFRYSLCKNFLWWYLKRIDEKPLLSDFGPLEVFNFKKNKGYLFKVSRCGGTINLDIFHALTDGTGAMTFLMSLTGEYVRLHYGKSISYNSLVLNPGQEPSESEFNDNFCIFNDCKGSLEKNRKAYHIKGRIDKKNFLKQRVFSFDLEDVKTACARYGCTVTDFISSSMIDALQRVRQKDGRFRKSPHIRISVPVNLRKIFDSRTLRNFSSYVNVGIDVSEGLMPFEDTVREVSLQKQLLTSRRRLSTKVAANVALENNRAIRIIPLAVKKLVISAIDLLKGDKYCSQTLSNLGNIILPEQMRPYVENIGFVLGRPRVKSGSCTCLSYDGRLNMTLSRRILEDDFEEAFLEVMENLGVRVLSVR